MANSTGMFVRTLPICHSWEESVSVERYLQNFQEEFYAVMGHDCISFAELAKDYGIASDILFVYQGEMFQGLSVDGGKYAAVPLVTGDVQADASVMVMKQGEDMRFPWSTAQIYIVRRRLAVYLICCCKF